MMPPECSCCGREQSDFPSMKFEIVYFKRTPEDEDWYRRSEEEGWEGHPPNAYWFCSDHLELALKYESLNVKEAMSKIKK